MSDLIAEWCAHHHNLNNISAQRRTRQLRWLRAFEATLPGPVERVDGRDVERFMEQLIRDGYHPHTVLCAVRMVKPFLAWCWRQGLIDPDRWLRIKDVRAPRGAYDGVPRPYTRQEIRRFWIELDKRYPWTRDRDPQLRTPARGEHWVRRWAEGRSRWRRVYPYARRLQVEAIVSLALYAGLRRDEIYNLGLDDMHYQNEYVRVVSRKGPDAREKVRVAPMNEPLALAVGNWIEFRSQILDPPHDFPWLCLWAGSGANRTTVDQPMSHTQFQSVLYEVGKGYSLHRLRHTFATERCAAGMPIEVLKEVMGHADVKQTLAYAKVSEDRIIEASRASDDAFLSAVRRAA